MASPPEKKGGVFLDPSIAFAGPNTGRIVYFDGAIYGDLPLVARSTAYAGALYAYVAMRYRAENLAAAPLVVVEETDDGEKIIAHQLDRLLQEPSPDLDMGELLELTQLYEDRDGQALWVKDANLLGQTGRLTPFPGRDFTVKQTAAALFGEFRLNTARGQKTLSPEDVVFFHYLNPGVLQEGLSPLDVALTWLNLGTQINATIRNLVRNGVWPSLVINTDPEWHPDDDEYRRFMDQLATYHAGADNAGKPFVNLGGGRSDRVQYTLNDLLPGELLNRIESVVAAAFRIPPVVLGFMVGLQNSPWSQMEQAHRQAHTDALVPLWKRKAKALTRQLLRPIDANPRRHIRFDLSGIAALQDDESKKITDAGNAKTWTVNERRIHTGQDPLDESDPRGDWIEALATASIVGGWGETPATPTFGGPGAGAPPEKPEKGLKRAPHDPSWKWSRYDLLTKAQEDGWTRTVARQLGHDRDAVVSRVNGKEFAALWAEALPKSLVPGHGIEAKAPPFIDPSKLEALVNALAKALDASRWTEAVEGPIGSTAKLAVQDVAKELGVSFDLLSPALADYTRTEAAWLVTGINGTTRDRIAGELRAGLLEGDGIPELAKRLEDAAAFSRDRAELVARTETTRVTNGSQRDALADFQVRESVTVQKSWLSARDSRVREEHAALDDGSWIGVDQTFPNGLSAPGEPNCRCTILFRIPEES